MKKSGIAIPGFSILMLFVLFSTMTPIPAFANTDLQSLSALSLEELLHIRIESATKKPDRISDVPASVWVITREEIATYGYLTIEEILENIPGLYNIDDYNGSNKFGVRGFWSYMESDGLIFLVNGINYEFHYISATSISQYSLSVDAIDRIEFVRGPMSVTYGQGAFYGIINITTNETLDHRTNSVKLSYGSLNTIHSSAITSGKIEEIEYRINVSAFKSAGLEYDYSELTTNPSYIDGNMKDKRNVKGNTFSSSIKYKKFRFDIAFHRNVQDSYFNFIPVSKGNESSHEFNVISATYEDKLFKNSVLKASCNFTHHNRWTDFEMSFEGFYGHQLQRSNAVETEINLNNPINDHFDITINLHYRSVLDVMNMFDLPSFGVSGMENNQVELDTDSRIDILASSSQLTWKANDHFSLVFGGRLETMLPYKMRSQHVHFDSIMVNNIVTAEYDYSDINFIPRAAIVYHLNKQHTFKFLYGSAINRPSFFQNTKNTLDPSADQLEPEKIETFEINYIGLISSNIMLNTSVYFNKLDNLVTRIIEFDDDGNYFTWNKNAGRLETVGSEIALNLNFSDNLKLDVSFILQETKDRTAGFSDIVPAYSPEILSYLRASYKYQNIKLALSCNYVDKMESYYDNRPVEVGSDELIGRVGDTAPEYFIMSSNVVISDFLKDNIFLNFKVYNLLDSEIRYPTFNNNAWIDKGTLGYPRMFLLGAGMKF